MRVAVAIFATFALLPAIASADEKKADKNDPDRIICEKQKELGSRLATKKICMTAAEWEVRKREDREAIDKGQMQARGPSGS
jgi:hypothetical protein